MYDVELAREVLRQIYEAAKRVERRFSTINSPEDFLATEDGSGIRDLSKRYKGA